MGCGASIAPDTRKNTPHEIPDSVRSISNNSRTASIALKSIGNKNNNIAALPVGVNGRGGVVGGQGKLTAHGRKESDSFFHSGLVHLEAKSNSKTLFNAIKRDDIATVKRLLAVDELLYQSVGMWNSTPLIVAVQYGHIIIAKILLDQIENLNNNIAGGEGGGAVMNSARKREITMRASVNRARNSIGKRTNRKVGTTDQDGGSDSSDAADDSLEAINTEHINHVNDKGATALHYACMEGMAATVKRLLKLGSEINPAPCTHPIYNQLIDKLSICTPFSIAVANGHALLVRILLNAAAAKDKERAEKKNKNNNNIIHSAMSSPLKGIVPESLQNSGEKNAIGMNCSNDIPRTLSVNTVFNFPTGVKAAARNKPSTTTASSSDVGAAGAAEKGRGSVDVHMSAQSEQGGKSGGKVNAISTASRVNAMNDGGGENWSQRPSVVAAAAQTEPRSKQQQQQVDGDKESAPLHWKGVSNSCDLDAEQQQKQRQQPQATSENGFVLNMTPLLLACANGHLSVVQELFAFEANANNTAGGPGPGGFIPFHSSKKIAPHVPRSRSAKGVGSMGVVGGVGGGLIEKETAERVHVECKDAEGLTVFHHLAKCAGRVGGGDGIAHVKGVFDRAAQATPMDASTAAAAAAAVATSQTSALSSEKSGVGFANLDDGGLGGEGGEETVEHVAISILKLLKQHAITAVNASATTTTTAARSAVVAVSPAPSWGSNPIPQQAKNGVLHLSDLEETAPSPTSASKSPSSWVDDEDYFLDNVDINGDTCLHVACDHKQAEIARFFLNEFFDFRTKSAIVNCGNELTNMTPLHLAIRRKSLDLVKLLLENGANPLLKDVSSQSSVDLVRKVYKQKDHALRVEVEKAAAGWLSLKRLVAENSGEMGGDDDSEDDYSARGNRGMKNGGGAGGGRGAREGRAAAGQRGGRRTTHMSATNRTVGGGGEGGGSQHNSGRHRNTIAGNSINNNSSKFHTQSNSYHNNSNSYSHSHSINHSGRHASISGNSDIRIRTGSDSSDGGDSADRSPRHKSRIQGSFSGGFGNGNGNGSGSGRATHGRQSVIRHNMVKTTTTTAGAAAAEGDSEDHNSSSGSSARGSKYNSPRRSQACGNGINAAASSSYSTTTTTAATATNNTTTSPRRSTHDVQLNPKRASAIVRVIDGGDEEGRKDSLTEKVGDVDDHDIRNAYDIHTEKDGNAAMRSVEKTRNCVINNVEAVIVAAAAGGVCGSENGAVLTNKSPINGDNSATTRRSIHPDESQQERAKNGGKRRKGAEKDGSVTEQEREKRSEGKKVIEEEREEKEEKSETVVDVLSYKQEMAALFASDDAANAFTLSDFISRDDDDDFNVVVSTVSSSSRHGNTKNNNKSNYNNSSKGTNTSTTKGATSTTTSTRVHGNQSNVQSQLNIRSISDDTNGDGALVMNISGEISLNDSLKMPKGLLEQEEQEKEEVQEEMEEEGKKGGNVVVKTKITEKRGVLRAPKAPLPLKQKTKSSGNKDHTTTTAAACDQHHDSSGGESKGFVHRGRKLVQTVSAKDSSGGGGTAAAIGGGKSLSKSPVSDRKSPHRPQPPPSQQKKGSKSAYKAGKSAEISSISSSHTKNNNNNDHSNNSEMNGFSIVSSSGGSTKLMNRPNRRILGGERGGGDRGKRDAQGNPSTGKNPSMDVGIGGVLGVGAGESVGVSGSGSGKYGRAGGRVEGKVVERGGGKSGGLGKGNSLSPRGMGQFAKQSGSGSSSKQSSKQSSAVNSTNTSPRSLRGFGFGGNSGSVSGKVPAAAAAAPVQVEEKVVHEQKRERRDKSNDAAADDVVVNEDIDRLIPSTSAIGELEQSEVKLFASTSATTPIEQQQQQQLQQQQPLRTEIGKGADTDGIDAALRTVENNKEEKVERERKMEKTKNGERTKKMRIEDTNQHEEVKYEQQQKQQPRNAENTDSDAQIPEKNAKEGNLGELGQDLAVKQPQSAIKMQPTRRREAFYDDQNSSTARSPSPPPPRSTSSFSPSNATAAAALTTTATIDGVVAAPAISAASLSSSSSSFSSRIAPVVVITAGMTRTRERKGSDGEGAIAEEISTPTQSPSHFFTLSPVIVDGSGSGSPSAKGSSTTAATVLNKVESGSGKYGKKNAASGLLVEKLKKAKKPLSSSLQ